MYFLLIYSSIFEFSNCATLTIEKSERHEDKSGNYTPLVVSLSIEDIKNKTKPIDLICIVDISGSMYLENKIENVIDSLKYLINSAESIDQFALVTFSSDSEIVHNLTYMTQENKNLFLESVGKLVAMGGTNIYSGLEKGLSLLTNDYSSGERIASMILLSDGDDNYSGKDLIPKIKKLLIDTNKKNYTFTLHSFGYGDGYFEPEVLRDIALIKDGFFAHIKSNSEIEDSYQQFFGALSTVYDVDIQLMAQSKFNIVKAYGIEDMYERSLMHRDVINFVKVVQK